MQSSIPESRARLRRSARKVTCCVSATMLAEKGCAISPHESFSHHSKKTHEPVATGTSAMSSQHSAQGAARLYRHCYTILAFYIAGSPSETRCELRGKSSFGCFPTTCDIASVLSVCHSTEARSAPSGTERPTDHRRWALCLHGIATTSPWPRSGRSASGSQVYHQPFVSCCLWCSTPVDVVEQALAVRDRMDRQLLGCLGL